MAPLSADGLELEGPTTRLVKQDLDWEGDLIEAPTLVQEEESYVLMYSANDYGGGDYAVGYATAAQVTGPFTKAAGPLLTSQSLDGAYFGPGGQDVVTGPDGDDYLVFHSWYADLSYRGMNVIPLTWTQAPATEDGSGAVPVVDEG